MFISLQKNRFFGEKGKWAYLKWTFMDQGQNGNFTKIVKFWKFKAKNMLRNSIWHVVKI